MKLAEYGKLHNLENEQDWINYFRYNLHTGKLPVAIYSCPYCDEIIDPTHKHGCVSSYKKEKEK